MSGSDEEHKQKVVIGGLMNIADVLAKRVLVAYNASHTYNTNLTNISKCHGDQLEACAKLLGLKTRSDDGKDTKLYKNKGVLADRIILKIESLFEAKCGDCDKMYQNTLDSTPIFTCRLCWLGSHDCQEIKEKAANVGTSLPSGYVWICLVCLQKNNLDDMHPENTTKSADDKQKHPQSSGEPLSVIDEDKELEAQDFVVVEEENKDEEEHEEETSEVTEERISPRRGRDQEVKKKKPKIPKDQICEAYKRRSCPHGRSGKKQVHGKVCSDNHPKRCFKFCDFGAKHRNGCKKGKQCQFWHPRLCKHSVKGNICEIKGCTFQHLKNLRAQKDTEMNRRTLEPGHPQSKTGQYRGNRKISLAPSQERTDQKEMLLRRVSASSSLAPYQPTITKAKGAEKMRADDETFLFKLIENLRAGFQDQIEGLRNEIMKDRERSKPIQMGASIHQQGMLAAEQQQLHPVYHALPGMAHPSNFQAMLGQQRY